MVSSVSSSSTTYLICCYSMCFMCEVQTARRSGGGHQGFAHLCRPCRHDSFCIPSFVHTMVAYRQGTGAQAISTSSVHECSCSLARIRPFHRIQQPHNSGWSSPPPPPVVSVVYSLLRRVRRAESGIAPTESSVAALAQGGVGRRKRAHDHDIISSLNLCTARCPSCV